ncbi:hypothetical protein [Streptomyces sp. NBC_00435]|uniref:hypothetical protein n=1 Tax=Streptomyces sp. NBC_00435 TaxID=2903649 RepID=UPI002E1B8F64
MRKKSLPVAAALASPGAAARELATLYTGSGRLFAAQLTRAAELVEAAGGRAWAEREAQEHIGRALDQLTAARASEPAAAELATLAHLIIHRDR